MKAHIQKMLPDNPNIFGSNALIILILVVVTALSFSTAINSEFTSWDDNYYVVENRWIKDFSMEGLTRLWTERTGLGGTRLTLTSFMLDYELWGLDSRYYHAENVLWHILNTVLLFFLITRLVKNRKVAFITAIMFAVHPMHVESVAWVTERKDLLYTFFLLLCFHAYISYVQTKKPLKKGLYWLAFTLSFLLSWHSKFSAVIIPPLLFLIDYILRRRFTIWLIIEKLPILVFTASEVYRIAFGSYARMDFQGKKLVASGHQTYRYSLFEKSLLAAYSLMFYLWRFIMPVKLSAIMPYPIKSQGNFPLEYYLAFGLAIVVLIGIAIILLRLKRDRREYIFGFLFFLISIFAFLHFISIKGVVVVADRYTYVPYIGLSFMLAVFLSNIRSPRLSRILWMGFILVAVTFAISSFQRNKVWKDDIALFSNVLKHNPNVLEALNNRGNAYNFKGRYDLALEDFNRGIELQPAYKNFYNNRAQSYFQLDSFELALADLDMAIKLDPRYLDAYLNKGQVLMTMKDYDHAVWVYSKAIEMAPYRAKMYLARAEAYLELDQREDALADFRKAVEVHPRSYRAFYQLGRWYSQNGDFQLAVENLEKARELNPLVPEVYNELGNVLNKAQDFKTAREHLDKAIEIGPFLPAAYNNRGISNFQLGNQDSALSDFNKAIQIDSTFARAYSNRGNFYAASGEFEKALDDYKQAISYSEDDCISMVNRGNVYYQLGDPETACASWQEALECGFLGAGDLLKSYCEGHLHVSLHP
jgi:tetratricopeptide (TPR) repeat protein